LKALCDNIQLSFDESDKPQITITMKLSRRESLEQVSKLKELLQNGKLLEAEIKQHRKKRSLDANSYCWVLISKIAEVINTDKDSVYIEMLCRYGQREPQLISVIAEGVPAIERATRNHCVEVGESELNGKLFKHMAILIGSSQYDSREMSVLIDGIVSDAKELGIETMTPAELAVIKQEWGKRDE
jgi:hypothetical protein